MGLMVESNLHAGRQNWLPDAPLRYGVSITDACIGWDETEALLFEMAAAVGSIRETAGGRPLLKPRAPCPRGAGGPPAVPDSRSAVGINH